MKGVQFYFNDSEHQISNRISAMPRLDASIVKNLLVVLQPNPYADFLKQAPELNDIDQYCIVVRSDPGLDQRTYNKPLSNEVAGIWIEDESEENANADMLDIRVFTKSDILTQEQQEFTGPSIDTDIDMNEDSPLNHNQRRKRWTLSCREYYLYKLQDGVNDKSYILRFGRLFQQYRVDNYIKIESMPLQFLKTNQKNTRREYYQGVQDSVISGVISRGKVGKGVYLPATFIGGPRDMRHRYLDLMALVQEYGRPDIFLTMTCNPNWLEIKERLQPGKEAYNRPDLLARVFKAKLNILNEKIMSGEIFGEVASVVHVIEFQKRGLPHTHFLIILKPTFKYLSPEAYDQIVCAELPYQRTNPYLYSLVVKHMMYGPCGDLNPENVYIKEGKCKNHYPKWFCEHTTHGKGSYPVYQRQDNHRTTKVRGHTLDNRWVIPYNPTLLVQFDCHINVKICCDIRAVKYLYKYVHKGHDKIMFRIAPENSNSEVDEIADFQNARWVSLVEAAWRIYGFALHSMFPAVLQLQVHLPKFQTVQFEEDADLEQLLQDERQKRTMLTDFFNMNAMDHEASELNMLYKEFPQYYVWHTQFSAWPRRKRGIVIGRMCAVNPIENERYYLRVLLSNVRCPKSYDDLLIVNGVLSNSFQKASYK
ncbi:hypothetical protein LIER_36573 [Lithospermum erythrorhizon]|uniref:Helitron helicase-like domain-containing protein n=1 Tax=Lithospermum erythrorhizon TaxID=34254 RepID=A0AAV3PAH1_LITER